LPFGRLHENVVGDAKISFEFVVGMRCELFENLTVFKIFQNYKTEKIWKKSQLQKI
jgi:hypothetical protein